MTDFDYNSLKTRQRAIRESFPESLSLRVHRALSWLHRAEQETEDADARFIFLWIAFNGAYANDIGDRQDLSERKLFLGFLGRLIDSDVEKLLYTLVWEQFPGAIRLLIDNKFVFQPFWEFQNGRCTEGEWEDAFQRSKVSATRALGRMNTRRVLGVMFDRLYVLRNQIIHGGATWNSGVNRAQMAQGAEIMGLIVPIVIHLMMENSNQLWGDPCYPVVD